MAHVEGNISDLFFNTEHHFKPETDARGKTVGGEHDELEQEAKDFLDCLDRLCVPVPTVDELVADFKKRL